MPLYGAGNVYGVAELQTWPSAVAFKAMIATHLDRLDLTSQIVTFCDLAVQELEDYCLWFQLTSTTVPTVASTKYASLPTGFIKEVKEGLQNTSGAPLMKESWAEVDHWQRFNAGSGEPTYYAIADKFYFYPIPNAIYALPLQFYKRMGFPIDGESNDWVDEVWDLTFWAAMKQAWIYLQNPTEQAKAEIEMTRRLVKYKGRSGKNTGRGTVRYREF
jgi:hypothetical protein